MNVNFEIIREEWAAEAAESDMGLWWLAEDIRNLLGRSAAEDQVRSATLEAVRPLLESGKLRAVDIHQKGTFDVWAGTIDDQLARIESGWKAVGTPDIGDVVWFIGDR